MTTTAIETLRTLQNKFRNMVFKQWFLLPRLKRQYVLAHTTNNFPSYILALEARKQSSQSISYHKASWYNPYDYRFPQHLDIFFFSVYKQPEEAAAF